MGPLLFITLLWSIQMHALSLLHNRASVCKVHRHERGCPGNQESHGFVDPSSSHIRTTKQKEIHQLLAKISIWKGEWTLDSGICPKWSRPSTRPHLKMYLWPWVASVATWEGRSSRAWIPAGPAQSKGGSWFGAYRQENSWTSSTKWNGSQKWQLQPGMLNKQIKGGTRIPANDCSPSNSWVT